MRLGTTSLGRMKLWEDEVRDDEAGEDEDEKDEAGEDEAEADEAGEDEAQPRDGI